MKRRTNELLSISFENIVKQAHETFKKIPVNVHSNAYTDFEQNCYDNGIFLMFEIVIK